MVFYLYTLALLSVPFDFFTFYAQNLYGTTWTLSKMLQILTYIIILVKIVLDKDILIVKEIIDSYKLHKYFIIFFVFIIFVTLIGGLNNNYITVLNEGKFELKVRPVKEILIFFHQYFFFIVLAPIIINNKSKIKIVMKSLFFVLILNLIIAFIDYGLIVYGIEFITRHFYDGRDVGVRLHGLFGEPRDAYVGLIVSMCFFYVYKSYFNQTLSIIFPMIFCLSLLLTFSSSAFVGAFLYLVIIYLIKIFQFFRKKQLKIKTWILFISCFIIMSLIFNRRNDIYIVQLFDTFINSLKYYSFNDAADIAKKIEFDRPQILPSNEEIVYERKTLSNSPLENNIPHGSDRTGTGLSAHVVNLLPLLEYIDRINRLEFWNFLFGKGSGTSSIFFNEVTKNNEISNPHSLFIKILFEYGIIGFCLYVYSLFKIVVTISKNIDLNSKNLIFGSFIMVGVPMFMNNSYMLHLFLTVLIICYYVEKKLIRIN